MSFATARGGIILQLKFSSAIPCPPTSKRTFFLYDELASGNGRVAARVKESRIEETVVLLV